MSKRYKSLAVGVLSAFFIYCLLGFLLLPGIALHLVNSQLEQRINVPAQLDSLEFNPFSLELTVGKLEIGKPEDPVLGFERLNANLQISSLWRGALQLERLVITRAYAAAILEKSGNLNLAQLLVSRESTQESAADGKGEAPFPLRIGRLALLESRLQFQDRQPATVVSANFDGINIEATQLSTVAQESGEISLEAKGPAGSHFQVQGTLGVVPLGSSGTVNIDDLPLLPFWPYVREQVALKLQSGQLSSQFDYQLDLAEGAEFKLEEISATLSSLGLNAVQDETLARLKQLQIDNGSFDLADRSIHVGKVRSRELEAWVIREQDGQLNWQKIMPEQQQRAAEKSDQKAAWHIRLPDVQLRDYQLNLSDLQPETPVNLQLSSLDLDMAGFDSSNNEPFELKLETQVADQGLLAAEGQASLDPLSLDMRVTAENIDLRLAQAYLTPLMRIELRDGLLATTAEVQLEATEPLSLSVKADAGISQLHVIDTIENRDLLKWEQLQLEQILFSSGSLSIAQAKLREPFARIIINQDLSTNLGNLLIEQPAKDDEPETAPLGIRIGAINVEQGSVNFADFSLQPNVVLTVQELTGRMGSLDNQDNKPADLMLTGRVDRYAPVRVNGSLMPFDPLNSLDIVAVFKDIELTTLSPYARKFAGYRIRKGQLDLNLHYRINDGELEAENQVLLRNLQLGEQVESPTAVDLPIRLAVALLKDGQGNIEITLPVQGNLNSPEFDIMPIIWQGFGNLLTRAATAPFRFIANLIGSDEDDLSQVLFTPGEAELDAQARQRLDSLATALNDRPALRLEVEGMSSPQADGPLVAKQRLERELARRWKKVVEEQQPDSSAAVPAHGIPEDARINLLEAIYQDRLKKEVPEEWSELEPQARVERMQQAVLETWQRSEALLRRLAQDRNANIKGYLVDEAGLAPARVQLLDVGISAETENGEVPSALHLGTD